MDVERVRRRNRLRLAVLVPVALANLWLILLPVLCAGPLYLGAELEDTLRVAVPVGAVAVLAFAAWSIRRTANATVKALGAEVIGPREWPRLRHIAEEVALAMGIDPVPVAVLTDPAPNALTVGSGRRRSVVLVTTGLVSQLTRDEVQAVMAVQLAAIDRLDVSVQTTVVAVSSGTVVFRRGLLFFLDFPVYGRVVEALSWPTKLVAQLIRRRALRTADFGADELAVGYARHPAALRSALVKLLEDERVVAAVTPQNAPLWFEPVPDGEDREHALLRFSMAPPLEERIARLPQV